MKENKRSSKKNNQLETIPNSLEYVTKEILTCTTKNQQSKEKKKLKPKINESQIETFKTQLRKSKNQANVLFSQNEEISKKNSQLETENKEIKIKIDNLEESMNK